jgi:probable nitrogen fixation protein
MISAPRHGTAPDATFLRELVLQFRAQAGDAAWDGRSDFELLAPLVLRKQRKDPGAPGEVDPDVFWRIELFYRAVGCAVEARSGAPCTLMMKMHHEGSGRVVLLAGRLVVVNKHLRDVRRFGFESLARLDEAGERLVSGAVEMIHRFPEAARYAG